MSGATRSELKAPDNALLAVSIRNATVLALCVTHKEQRMPDSRAAAPGTCNFRKAVKQGKCDA